jgi:hypothetical protein
MDEGVRRLDTRQRNKLLTGRDLAAELPASAPGGRAFVAVRPGLAASGSASGCARPGRGPGDGALLVCPEWTGLEQRYAS